jgi:hypothetical protein
VWWSIFIPKKYRYLNKLEKLPKCKSLVKKISGQQLLMQKKPKSLDCKFKIKNQRRIREIQIPKERVLTRRGSIAMNDGERWRHDE